MINYILFKPKFIPQAKLWSISYPISWSLLQTREVEKAFVFIASLYQFYMKGKINTNTYYKCIMTLSLKYLLIGILKLVFICFSTCKTKKKKKMNEILLMNKFNEDISFFRFHWIEILNYLGKVWTIMNVDLIIPNKSRGKNDEHPLIENW